MRFFLVCGFWILSAATAAHAAQPSAAEELPFEAQVQPCWSPPAGADTPVTVAFTLNPDGSLDQKPVIKKKGDGALNEAFAQSALRAVLRCSPYKVTDKLEFETTFIPDPTKARPSAAAPHKDPAADVQDGDPRTRIVDFGTVKISFKVPEGLCAIDPKRGGYHERLWKALAPPLQRKAELKSLDVDCVSLKASEAGGDKRPKYAFTMMRYYGGGQPVPADLPTFLDELEKDTQPLTPRFWEDPPVAGSPFLGRDDRAAYAAQRFLEDGKVVLSGVSAFTLVGRMPILMNHYAVEGPDLAAERQSGMAGIVAGMQVISGD
ncbi:hypothetical protein J2X76_001814 [Neorhizobium sp. 2083]|uniref:energy transducer TonB family protein n=1 Tax=Neorhizobium sp. 2083 TaxID=2817762 RepID=UPI00285F3457|nr:energy transducer TonB [Neorhizobium sp. 2083]MDR6816641.1 hypothetical protein [Neorhizobium sp. 2083]